MTTTSPRRVLITGLNGYIAAHTAAVFLQAGYVVRGTVRRARTPNVESVVRALKPYHDGNRLEVVEVPDMGTDGAFDHAMKGVQAVAHLASPVSMTETDAAPMMRAAVQGTTSLLASALAESNRSSPLRSVVFMSTISAIFSPGRPAGHVFTEADWNDAAEAEMQRLGRKTPGYVVYQASKTAAERAFWRFADESRPRFGMVALCPAPVLGPPLYLPTPVSSLSMRVRDIYNILSGGPVPAFDSPVRSTFVDVRDVAELVLRAVEQDLLRAKSVAGAPDPVQIQGGEREDSGYTRERYLLVGQSGVSPQAMAEVLREGFHELRNVIRQAGESGDATTLEGLAATWGFSSNKAGRLLGREWTGFRQSVLESARAVLQAGRE
ncbi:hypothetical protein VTJ83DRAFT_1469 [Remersonia thermophila]|uniref:NAD-dependent epimerase/dehydratase domain-containing protein n=1 Tax=Remersonia thermophila TaxID=72144 RepID=A0ABR4DG10_9PEZI